MGSLVIFICIALIIFVLWIGEEEDNIMVLLSDKVYRILKWVCIIVLPALATLWFTLGKIWGFPYLAEVEGTIVAIDTFLGALIGISTMQYNKLDSK